MIESIKNCLWDLLKDKKISLAMIYNKEGEILWHKGRKVIGKNINHGQNFCKSYILKSLEQKNGIDKENVSLSYMGDELSESADRLLIKSIFIIPIENEFFLYVDSGVQIHFTETDRSLFRLLGNLLKKTIQKIKADESGTRGILGNSSKINQVKQLVLKYSLEEDCILLLGETGVGKTHIARLIHDFSGRKGQFVIADTTTINENLFESVIFGHKKGSFTGAYTDRRGLIDEAEGGTLFFDEVSEVPLSFQAKLLRFIETKQYRVLGDPAEKCANVRIIAASNKELQKLVLDKEFREDLYYRLNILQIKIPSLRERKDDIRLIVDDKKYYLKEKEIGQGFWQTLVDYHWPGNYRELFTVLKRAGILCSSPITGQDLRQIMDESKGTPPGPQVPDRLDLIWQQLEKGENFWQTVKIPFLNRDLNRLEVKAIVDRGLQKIGGRYIDLMSVFNLNKTEYKKFMRFLNHNKIN